jgi:hypothetical protein
MQIYLYTIFDLLMYLCSKGNCQAVPLNRRCRKSTRKRRKRPVEKERKKKDLKETLVIDGTSQLLSLFLFRTLQFPKNKLNKLICTWEQRFVLEAREIYFKQRCTIVMLNFQRFSNI